MEYLADITETISLYFLLAPKCALTTCESEKSIFYTMKLFKIIFLFEIVCTVAIIIRLINYVCNLSSSNKSSKPNM